MIGFAMIIHFIPDDAAKKTLSKMKTIPLVAYVLVFFAFLILYGYFKTAELAEVLFTQPAHPDLFT